MARHSHSQGSKRSTHSSLTQDTENTESILAKFTEAEKLEEQLAAIEKDKKAKRKLPAGTDQKAQGLRAKLCQVLIEAIVADPVFAHSNEASRRLWHSCFYSRISELRFELSKEKSRAKKRRANGGDVAGSEKILGVVKERLKGSIEEALKLYEWLIDKMSKLLMPMSQSSNSSDNSDNEDYDHSVIAILYWSHLYMGDLLRYNEAYKQAEEIYLKTSKLYPGNGNPFNQLAVVAQSQESLSAVALYYYARSIMATGTPSTMSASNLERLFTSNTKWLEEHGREGDLFSREIFDVNQDEGNKADKKEFKQWQQRQKSAMNRMALAKFVALQSTFLKGVPTDEAMLQDAIHDMDSMLEIFTKLINNASFSESLCCKIVVILSFGTLGAGNGGKLSNASTFDKKRRKDPNWKEDDIITNSALAFSFVLRFCTALMNDADRNLAKKEGKKLGSIRSLAAMLLCVSFINAMYQGSEWFHGLPLYPSKGSSSVEPSLLEKYHTICELCKHSHDDFWASVARVADQLDKISKSSSKDADASAPDLMDVKEFAEFCGYVPFDSFLKSAASPANGNSKYASTEEVISILTQKKSMVNQKTESEMQTIIQLFISFADENTALSTAYGYDQSEFYLARNPDTNRRELYQSNDSISVQEDDDGADAIETNFVPESTPVEEEMETTKTLDQDEDIVMKDVVPLKMTYTDNGVGLLTPAALLGGSSQIAVPPPPALDEVKKADQVPSQVLEVSQKAVAASNVLEQIQPPQSQPKATLPPPPGLMPPPGFSQQPVAPNNAETMQNNGFNENMNLIGIAQTAPVQTLNPFAQVAPALINEFGASLNPPTHFNINQGLGNDDQYRKTLGMGPSMNSLFNSNQSLDQLVSSDAFGLVPQQAEPDDQSDSIMKFLFESSESSSGKLNSSSMNDPSFHTLNPFAK